MDYTFTNIDGMSISELVAWGIETLTTKETNGTINKTETERLTNARRYLADTKDSGRIGKAFEALFVNKKSRKKKCSAQGKVDNYFNLNGKRYPVEYKINGGRIESLYDIRKPEKAFIVYALEYTVPLRENKDGSIAGGEHRVISPIIMTVKDFLNVIDTLHAFKFPEHAGKGDREKAVAASSKKLYECLKDYPIVFNPNANYTSDDFDGIELF
jgi:hypothetical protein